METIFFSLTLFTIWYFKTQ